MPRKRKTRAITNAVHRPNAVLPEGDGEQSMKPEDREDKLRIMIADFENEVKIRIDNLYSEKKKLSTKIQAAYSLELMKIPKHIREMKVTDFLKYGGQVNDCGESADDEEDMSIDAKVQSVKAAMSRMPLQTVNEENENNKQMKPPAGKRGRQVMGKATSTMAPPSTAVGRRTRQRMFETPAQRRFASRPGFETPLVTPKFDPRLPITPATGRNPKPNERIMSITGSPIYIKNSHFGQKPDLLQVLQSCDNTDVDSLLLQPSDPVYKKKLELLYKKLGQVLRE